MTAKSVIDKACMCPILLWGYQGIIGLKNLKYNINCQISFFDFSPCTKGITIISEIIMVCMNQSFLLLHCIYLFIYEHVGEKVTFDLHFHCKACIMSLFFVWFLGFFKFDLKESDQR